MDRIIATRIKIKRCSEVVHEKLKSEGVSVSLSTVKRVLSRYGCLKKRSLWKKQRRYPIRPDIQKQGDLVEFDTIHFVDRSGKREYVYTALDVYSRRLEPDRDVSMKVQCRPPFRFNVPRVEIDRRLIY